MHVYSLYTETSRTQDYTYIYIYIMPQDIYIYKNIYYILYIDIL